MLAFRTLDLQAEEHVRMCGVLQRHRGQAAPFSAASVGIVAACDHFLHVHPEPGPSRPTLASAPATCYM